MAKFECIECGNKLTQVGVNHVSGSESFHCENCHLDQVHVRDPHGSDFMDDRDQHDPDDCDVCADGGPPEFRP